MPHAMTETPETIELILTFPEQFPDSKVYAASEAEEEALAEQDYLIEQHIARNYGDCGHTLHAALDDPFGYGLYGDLGPLRF
jgi:hypothetical protein